MNGPGPEARQLAAAIRDALNVPYAATVADEEVRNKIVENRLYAIEAALNMLADPDRDTPMEWQLDWLRGEMDKYPATGYKTWDQAVADRAKAE